MIFMPTGPCVRERGEYLKQKQMPAQRLDGHGWSSVLIIVSEYISSSSFLISKREYWIRFQTYFCFLTCSARTLNWRGQEHAQESHATSLRCSFLPNFFCPLTFEGPAVRSPLFTKTNPTKSKYIISKSKETDQQYPHASLCQMAESDKRINKAEVFLQTLYFNESRLIERAVIQLCRARGALWAKVVCRWPPGLQ